MSRFDKTVKSPLDFLAPKLFMTVLVCSATWISTNLMEMFRLVHLEPGQMQAQAPKPNQLLDIWDSFEVQSKQWIKAGNLVPPQRVVTNYYRRQNPIVSPHHDITMMSHIGASKLQRLLLLQEFWGGPMSVAVYFNSEDDVHIFQAFLRIHAGSPLLQMTSFHIMMEYHSKDTYPHNILRNIAIQYADTEFIVHSEADFVTKPNSYTELVQLLNNESTNIKQHLRANRGFILPCFDQQMDKNSTDVAKENLPKDKHQLKGLVDQGVIKVCYEWSPNIQSDTNFTEWFSNHQTSSNDIYYPIKPRHIGEFEPYLLVSKETSHRFFEGIRSSGDKQSFYAEAWAAGMEFFVLRDFYVLHRQHPSYRNMSLDGVWNMPQINLFINYVEARYRCKMTPHNEWVEIGFCV